MGCDIHYHFEVFNGDAEWEHVASEDDTSWDKEEDGDVPYIGRNYILFAILADVRNYDGVPYLASPRQIPEDASKVTKDDHDSWDCDAHSASFFNLHELSLYPWEKTEVTIEAWVSEAEYRSYRKTGEVTGHCRGVGGGTVQHISTEKMEARYQSNAGPDGTAYYTILKWVEPLTEHVTRFREKVIPYMRSIAPEHDPERVRIVFWFDN